MAGAGAAEPRGHHGGAAGGQEGRRDTSGHGGDRGAGVQAARAGGQGNRASAIKHRVRNIDTICDNDREDGVQMKGRGDSL